MAEPEYYNWICTGKTRGSKVGQCGFRPKGRMSGPGPPRATPWGDGPWLYIHSTGDLEPSVPRSPTHVHR